MPQVAAPHAFVGALTGSHGLPPIVQPLGHEVSALATPGLVVARARPVEAAGSGSIPTPVQRRARGASRTTAAAAPEPIAEAEPMEASHDAAVVGRSAAAAVAGPSAAAAVPVAPIRTMPTVSRLAVHVPDRPLTSAASAARPAAVQRAAAAASSAPVAAPSGVVPVPSSGGMRRVPSAMPVAKPTVSRQASSNADKGAPAEPSSQATVTRSGLGEPLTSVPASARPVTAGAPGPLVSRTTTSGPMPIAAASLRSPVQRAAADGGAASPLLALGPGSAGPAAPQPSAASLPALPHLPVARSAGAMGPKVSEVAPAAPVTVAIPEIRPLAGSNPIRTSIGLQREAADDLDDEAGDDDATLPSPWWAPAAEAVAQPGLAGPAAGTPSTSLQRSAARIASSPVTSPFVAGAAPTAQRTAPAVGPTRVQRIGAQAVRQGMPQMTLPRDPSHRANGQSAVPAESSIPTVSSPARTLGGGAVVQMSPAPASASFAGSLGPAAAVQREGGNVPLAPETPAAPAAPAGPAAPGGSSGSGGMGSSHSERDLDELAQALFGRIRGRIRSDLIQDREAKGLTFDHV